MPVIDRMTSPQRRPPVLTTSQKNGAIIDRAVEILKIKLTEALTDATIRSVGVEVHKRGDDLAAIQIIERRVTL